jgi:hypothetical protein
LGKFLLNTIYFLIIFNFINAQDFSPGNNNILQTRFVKQTVEFQKGELISNVLVVTNTSSEKQKFYINFTIPTDWKIITKNHILYELEPGDSLIIPVHAVPREKFKGAVRFLFYVYINDEKGNNIATNFFYCVLKKFIKWTVTVSDNKYYIPNKTMQVPFSVGVVNESSDEQEIFLTATTLRKDILIKDSSNTKDVRFPITMTLKSLADTQYYFTFNKLKEPRNFRLIDLDDYHFASTGEPKKYRILFNSYSSNVSLNNSVRSGNSIDFIELSNNFEVNKYNSFTIPLTVDANIYNILGGQPMMNLYLKGEMYLRDTSLLLYQAQLTYFSNYFSLAPYKNAVLSLGYFHKKFYLMAGNVNSGLLGTYQNGKGIKGEYYIKRKHRIGAFYVASPELFKIMPRIYSYGLSHVFENKIIKTSTIIGQNINQSRNIIVNAANTNIMFRLIKNHSFGIRLGGSQNIRTDTNITKFGYFLGANYSAIFIKNVWNFNISGMYNSPDFGVFRSERINAMMNNQVKLKKLQILLNNNYYRYKIYSTANYYNLLINNQLTLTPLNKKAVNYNPFVFYNISSIENFIVHSRGLGFNVSNYDLEKNSRYFFNLRSGYNRAIDTLSKDYFFTQAAVYVQYRTFSFMVRYTLGNLTVSKQSFFVMSNRNPQSLGISSRYQHQFKNPSFVYQQLVGYSYNTMTGNRINLTPELYYFVRSGWRFRIFTEINFSKESKFRLPQYYYYINNPELEIKEPEWNHDVFIGLGIRKEFGIPVPFVKPTNSTILFKAFYDVNGNSKQDNNETAIENVVIRVGPWEVITDEKGQAKLINIPNGKYNISVFSVADLKGWFPAISDTIVVNNNNELNIPFVRGVKITGKVFVQRDPNSPTADFKLDVSRIKITASNHKVYSTLTDKNGYYELYVPVGKYVLTLDESILGSRLKLMQNNFELNIDDKFDNLFIPFYIVEKPRKIKVIRFDNNGNIINDKD